MLMKYFLYYCHIIGKSVENEKNTLHSNPENSSDSIFIQPNITLENDALDYFALSDSNSNAFIEHSDGRKLIFENK